MQVPANRSAASGLPAEAVSRHPYPTSVSRAVSDRMCTAPASIARELCRTRNDRYAETTMTTPAPDPHPDPEPFPHPEPPPSSPDETPVKIIELPPNRPSPGVPVDNPGQP